MLASTCYLCIRRFAGRLAGIGSGSGALPRRTCRCTGPRSQMVDLGLVSNVSPVSIRYEGEGRFVTMCSLSLKLSELEVLQVYVTLMVKRRWEVLDGIC